LLKETPLLLSQGTEPWLQLETTWGMFLHKMLKPGTLEMEFKCCVLGLWHLWGFLFPFQSLVMILMRSKD
jgi:hypothetical protein